MHTVSIHQLGFEFFDLSSRLLALLIANLHTAMMIECRVSMIRSTRGNREECVSGELETFQF